MFGKSMEMQNVMDALALYHRQFQHLLVEMNAQYKKFLHYTKVPCKGWVAMLCHMYELRHEISVFTEKKGAEVPYGCVILHF